MDAQELEKVISNLAKGLREKAENVERFIQEGKTRDAHIQLDMLIGNAKRLSDRIEGRDPFDIFREA